MEPASLRSSEVELRQLERSLDFLEVTQVGGAEPTQRGDLVELAGAPTRSPLRPRDRSHQRELQSTSDDGRGVGINSREQCWQPAPHRLERVGRRVVVVGGRHETQTAAFMTASSASRCAITAFDMVVVASSALVRLAENVSRSWSIWPDSVVRPALKLV